MEKRADSLTLNWDLPVRLLWGQPCSNRLLDLVQPRLG